MGTVVGMNCKKLQEMMGRDKEGSIVLNQLHGRKDSNSTFRIHDDCYFPFLLNDVLYEDVVGRWCFLQQGASIFCTHWDPRLRPTLSPLQRTLDSRKSHLAALWMVSGHAIEELSLRLTAADVFCCLSFERCLELRMGRISFQAVRVRLTSSQIVLWKEKHFNVQYSYPQLWAKGRVFVLPVGGGGGDRGKTDKK